MKVHVISICGTIRAHAPWSDWSSSPSTRIKCRIKSTILRTWNYMILFLFITLNITSVHSGNCSSYCTTLSTCSCRGSTCGYGRSGYSSIWRGCSIDYLLYLNSFKIISQSAVVVGWYGSKCFSLVSQVITSRSSSSLIQM